MSFKRRNNDWQAWGATPPPRAEVYGEAKPRAGSRRISGAV